MINRITALAATLLLGVAAPAMAQSSMSGSMSSMHDPMVGGAPMYASKNIVQNAVNSKDHTTLVALVKKAGLVDTLEGPGPFTVIAPTNEAFAKLPKATVDKVTSDPALLKKVLTYHVLAGRVTAADIAAKIKAGDGKAELMTLEGEPITATMSGQDIALSGKGGGTAIVTIPNVYQSNGIIHVVNGVLIP
ncbi:MAG TPA: fasciclin domain-containing protein [Candidatus Sulfotelmatobacter sp.]|nr:fasciclin domain-containing protein [Candidatus Sulfotelmatobacter sp.]